MDFVVVAAKLISLPQIPRSEPLLHLKWGKGITFAHLISLTKYIVFRTVTYETDKGTE